jgi:putative ABC transport system ATP-binding protein
MTGSSIAADAFAAIGNPPITLKPKSTKLRMNLAIDNGLNLASTNATKDVLQAAGLTKQVTSPEGHLTILDDVTLAIPGGQTAAIIGASGAGKSTLLALLAGLDEPSSGKVWINDVELTALDEDGRAAVRAKHVGFVFQSFHLVPSLTAIENVMLPLELAGQRNARQAALEVLEKVGLAARAGHYPRQLSGGEQQRVAIARAFVTKPAILFADEPTGNLDAATGERIIQLLFELNRATHTTLVFVTHDKAIAERCERVIKLDAGKVVAA